jgi:hypothetical protein
MGDPLDVGSSVSQKSFEYTSTKSIFTLGVEEKVELKVTFLSPVVPDDLKRSSLPFSYMEVDVHSVDGSEHDVQLYTDISAGKSKHVLHYDLANDLSRMGLGRPDSHRRMVLRRRLLGQPCNCIPQGLATRAATLCRDQPADRVWQLVLRCREHDQLDPSFRSRHCHAAAIRC